MANLFGLSGMSYTDTGGIPYASAKLYTYETGTTTNKATYSNAALSSANANPVVAGSDGVFGDIYCVAGRYKFVLKTSADVTLQTWDPWDASSELIAAASAPSPTYPFLRYHNTTDGHVYRRNAADSAWLDEGAVDSLLNAASVTQQLAGTSTAVSSTPDSVAGLWQRGTDITPAGASVSLPSTGGGVFNIAAGNFSSISSAQGGRIVVFEFAGASVITHNASSLDLPGNLDITTVAGDRAAFVNLAAADASGSNWRCLWFVRDAAVPTTVATQAEMEAASSTTAVPSAAVVQNHPGVAKFWGKFTANSTTIEASYNVTSVADTATGRMTVTIGTDFSSVDWACLITVENDGGANLIGAQIENASQAAGTIIIEARNQGAGLDDPATWHIVGFGDQ